MAGFLHQFISNFPVQNIGNDAAFRQHAILRYAFGAVRHSGFDIRISFGLRASDFGFFQTLAAISASNNTRATQLRGSANGPGGLNIGMRQPLLPICSSNVLGNPAVSRHYRIPGNRSGPKVASVYMPGTTRFDEPEAAAGWQLGHECCPIRPAAPLDVLPVIHAGALELGVVQFESEGLD